MWLKFEVMTHVLMIMMTHVLMIMMTHVLMINAASYMCGMLCAMLIIVAAAP